MSYNQRKIVYIADKRPSQKSIKTTKSNNNYKPTNNFLADAVRQAKYEFNNLCNYYRFNKNKNAIAHDLELFAGQFLNVLDNNDRFDLFIIASHPNYHFAFYAMVNTAIFVNCLSNKALLHLMLDDEWCLDKTVHQTLAMSNLFLERACRMYIPSDSPIKQDHFRVLLTTFYPSNSDNNAESKILSLLQRK